MSKVAEYAAHGPLAQSLWRRSHKGTHSIDNDDESERDDDSGGDDEQNDHSALRYYTGR